MASKTDQLYKHIIVLLKILNTITQYLVEFPLTYTIYVVHTLSVIRGVMLNTRNKKNSAIMQNVLCNKNFI